MLVYHKITDFVVLLLSPLLLLLEPLNVLGVLGNLMQELSKVGPWSLLMGQAGVFLAFISLIIAFRSFEYIGKS